MTFVVTFFLTFALPHGFSDVYRNLISIPRSLVLEMPTFARQYVALN